MNAAAGGTLAILHGHTMNAALMRAHVRELLPRLPTDIELLFPEAPHECEPGAVTRLYELWKVPRSSPPHRTWWDANADGSVYTGLSESLAQLRSVLEGRPRLALLGFSQGAILATALCALARAGEFPEVQLAVLVAGRRPRAHALAPYLGEPLAQRSVHVWGAADPLAGGAPELSEAFVQATRTVVTWPGDHRVPSRGAAADAIAAAVREWAEG